MDLFKSMNGPSMLILFASFALSVEAHIWRTEHRPHGRGLRQAGSNALGAALLDRRQVRGTQTLLVDHSEDPDEKKKKRKSRVMTAINKFRAAICAQMHSEHFETFDSFDACEAFMKKACRPGGDLMMDGDKKEISSGEGYCKEWFPIAEKKAEEEVARIEAEEAAAEAAAKAEEAHAAPAPSPAAAPSGGGPTPGPAATTTVPEGSAPAAAADEDTPAAAAPAAAENEIASAPAADGTGSAPAGAPAAGSPGSSPSSSDGSADLGATERSAASPGYATQPTKPEWAAEKDGWASWYYKNGGTDQKSRLGHMDGQKRGLPSQGFVGRLVGHKDMQTSTHDWQKEFGTDWSSFCAEHPESPWCPPSHRSASYMSSLAPLSIALVIAVAVHV